MDMPPSTSFRVLRVDGATLEMLNLGCAASAPAEQCIIRYVRRR